MSRYYSKDHEWLEIDGNVGTIGITDYAQHQLGDITYVELPEVGTEIKQFSIFCTIESVKAASDVYAPVSGEIIEVNSKLENEPEIINKSPEEEGWIAKVKVSDPSELNNLMDKASYENYIKELD
ncbi:Glycine cleavage system H protein [Thermodesulfobium narugense DSM 14796]|uniref:Glycine cleavage system H protein n=1 Tax=Thermodesulfobium narugense DSM 14796 TaxID=747365 RepID=M1E532_9BACT|nr:glycine cleavage system protein GcvH [Thermodesulfobium narugense]AEE14772.1 Glycine cleavage system H protein [Thermodesulfobium narugense DSM 14796]